MADFEASGENTNKNDGYKVIGRKSWVAYIGLFAIYPLLILGVFVVYLLNFAVDSSGSRDPITITIFFLVIAVLIAIFVYKFAVIRSYQIYVTRHGVWYKYGILPWAKRGNGIRWSDIDMPFFYPNFLSWLTDSYTISVNHRYTNSSDFVVTHIWHGKDVCSKITRIQNKLQQSRGRR